MCTYDLKYNDYNSSVSDGLRSLLATSDISDITLAVEGKFFKAHQVILSIFSPYFRELFCVNPSKHTIFFMKNVKYRIMHNLLAFMYEGMVQIPEEDFNLFWETANELKIKGLCNSGEPHSRAKVSQMPVESAPVVGIEAQQSADGNPPKPANCLKRPAESVQASPTGAAIKKSKVGAQVSHEPAAEVNVLASDAPSTSWDSASLEHVQEVLPIVFNVTGNTNIPIKKEVDSYAEENTSHCMQTAGTINLGIKLEPEEVPVSTLLERLGDMDAKHLGANEGYSAPYETAPEQNVLSSAAPSTSWDPAPLDCAQEDVPTFVNVTADTNIHTKEEADFYSDEDTTYSMQNEDSTNVDGSGGDTTCDTKWESEDTSGGNMLVPLYDADYEQLGDDDVQHAEDATNKIMPYKTELRYEQKYGAYCTWRSENGARQTTEDVFLAYLAERRKCVNPATLCGEHCMLRTMIKLRENVDVKDMDKVQRYLKQYSKTYTPKTSRTLTDEECMKFLKDAPDDMYLMMKVALIIGIYGTCGRFEMTHLEVDHIKICEDHLEVTIQQAKTINPRTFNVPNSIIDGIQMAEFVKRYISLRPAHIPHNRLFISYSRGKCTTVPVGKNMFSKIPSYVVQYLKLPQVHLYTADCFRRTSAALMAKAGPESKIIICNQILQPGSVSD